MSCSKVSLPLKCGQGVGVAFALFMALSEGVFYVCAKIIKKDVR